MATHFSMLAWRIPWTEKPGGLQFMGSKESDTTECVHTGEVSVITGCASLFEQTGYDPLPILFFFFVCQSLASEPVKRLPDQSSDAVFQPWDCR